MKKCQGQSLVQFIIIMPVFFALLFGVFEMTYAYRAKATLNTATFEAVRAGALNHADTAVMKSVLANGMIAQYVKGDKSIIKGLGKAYLTSLAYEKAMSLKQSTVSIVAPTKEVFDKFKVNRMIQLSDQPKEKLQWIMPNDNLNFRSTNPQDITVDGKKQQINIQDANLLKIKTYWCYELKVPLLRDLIYQIIKGGALWGAASPEQKVCNIGSLFGGGRFMAISAHAVVRMQSPISAAADLK